MAKYDSEDLLEDILKIMTDSDALNVMIAQIEAEKTAKGRALTPTLAPIASTSYHLQTWTDKVLQSNPAVFYGIENVESLDGMGANAKTYTVFIEVVYTDNGQQNDTHKRISRYSRAIEDLFLKNFAPAMAMSKVKIAQVRPVSFKLELDSDEEIKVGGVSLTITLV